MSGEYKQFKLTNGEELICELVASGDEDSTADVIVRRAMKIVVSDDLEENIRYGSFLANFTEVFGLLSFRYNVLKTVAVIC